MKQILSFEGTTLADLARKARRHETVEQALRQALGPPLADHVSLGAIDAQRLVLVTDSPVWSNRLRYQAKAILASLDHAATGVRPRRLEVKVVPVSRPAAPAPQSGRALPAGAAAHLRAAAEAWDAGDPMRERLERLASRHRPAKRRD